MLLHIPIQQTEFLSSRELMQLLFPLCQITRCFIVREVLHQDWLAKKHSVHCFTVALLTEEAAIERIVKLVGFAL